MEQIKERIKTLVYELLDLDIETDEYQEKEKEMLELMEKKKKLMEVKYE